MTAERRSAFSRAVRSINPVPRVPGNYTCVKNNGCIQPRECTENDRCYLKEGGRISTGKHYEVTGPLHVVCKCDACAKVPDVTVAHYGHQAALAELERARATVMELKVAIQCLLEESYGGQKIAADTRRNARALLAKLDAEGK